MPGVRVRAAVAPVLIAAVAAALAFDQAGFFPHAWVWAAVLFFWGSILALLLPGDVRVGRPCAAFLAALALLTGWTLLSHIWSTVPGQALLEAAHSSRDVGEIALGAQLAEESVRRVERLECLALAAHDRKELGLLTRDLSGEEQILARRR